MIIKNKYFYWDIDDGLTYAITILFTVAGSICVMITVASLVGFHGGCP